MVNDKPKKITLNFIKDIQSGKKRVVNFLGCDIVIHRGVFPVDSPFSFSSMVTAKRIPKMLDVF